MNYSKWWVDFVNDILVPGVYLAGVVYIIYLNTKRPKWAIKRFGKPKPPTE